MNLKAFMAEVHAVAVEKGWWESQRPLAEVIANLHDEISEAWREYVQGHDLNEIRYEEPKSPGAPPKPVGFPIELADLVIRVLDACQHHGIDLEEAMRIKHEYNKTRSYRHGGKRA